MTNNEKQTHCVSCAMVPPAPGQKLCAQCQREHAILDREHEESEAAREEREAKRVVPFARAAVRIDGEWRVS